MKIYNYIKSTKTLGPYNRFALWVQGCPFSCTECMSPDSQDFNSGLEMSISAIVDLILNEINIEKAPKLRVLFLYTLFCLPISLWTE